MFEREEESDKQQNDVTDPNRKKMVTLAREYYTRERREIQDDPATTGMIVR